MFFFANIAILKRLLSDLFIHIQSSLGEPMDIFSLISDIKWSDPLVLGTVGIAAGGLAMLINTVLNLVSRAKSALILLIGAGGAGGASLLSEDTKRALSTLLGLG